MSFLDLTSQITQIIFYLLDLTSEEIEVPGNPKPAQHCRVHKCQKD